MKNIKKYMEVRSQRGEVGALIILVVAVITAINMLHFQYEFRKEFKNETNITREYNFIIDQKISDIRSLSYEEIKNIKGERLSLNNTHDYEFIKKDIINNSELPYIEIYLYIYKKEQMRPNKIIKLQKLENGQLLILEK